MACPNEECTCKKCTTKRILRGVAVAAVAFAAGWVANTRRDQIKTGAMSLVNGVKGLVSKVAAQVKTK